MLHSILKCLWAVFVQEVRDKTGKYHGSTDWQWTACPPKMERRDMSVSNALVAHTLCRNLLNRESYFYQFLCFQIFFLFFFSVITTRGLFILVPLFSQSIVCLSLSKRLGFIVQPGLNGHRSSNGTHNKLTSQTVQPRLNDTYLSFLRYFYLRHHSTSYSFLLYVLFLFPPCACR